MLKPRFQTLASSSESMGSLAQISGLGFAGLKRTTTESADHLATQAIHEAVRDAGLGIRDVDGLLISRSGNSSEPGLSLHARSGLMGTSLMQMIDGEGTSAIQMIQTASWAIAAGVVKHVVCVFSDTPLRSGATGREAFTKQKTVSGIGSLRYTAGAVGGAANYALSAARYLHEFGLDEEQLGHVAISTRAWASLNPDAVMRKPLTMHEYLAARYITQPLRLFDCALPVNGAIACVVSSPGSTSSTGATPVFVHGIAQANAVPGAAFNAWKRPATNQVKESLYSMARISASDVDVREFYDAFSIMTLLSLEDYGFCGAGEAGALAKECKLGPGGTLPTNTGGGHLSCSYMQGMTPVMEAIIQARGQAGERQCPRHDIVLATNDGGWFDHHAAMLLSKHESLN